MAIDRRCTICVYVVATNGCLSCCVLGFFHARGALLYALASPSPRAPSSFFFLLFFVGHPRRHHGHHQMDYLVEDMGLSVYDVLTFPAYFSYPLDSVIEPRTEFLSIR